MAELQFFATQDDHAHLISLLVAKYQARFVLDGGSLPEPSSFDNPNEILQIIQAEKNDPRFYVVSPLWTLEPLIVSEITHTDGRIRFYVRQRQGGAAFDYLARRLSIEATGEQIVPSWLSAFPSYRSSENGGAEISRPLAMLNAYRDAKRVLSLYSIRSDVLETQRPGPMVLPGALAAYYRGAWLRVGDWHHKPRTNGATDRTADVGTGK